MSEKFFLDIMAITDHAVQVEHGYPARDGEEYTIHLRNGSSVKICNRRTHIAQEGILMDRGKLWDIFMSGKPVRLSLSIEVTPEEAAKMNATLLEHKK